MHSSPSQRVSTSGRYFFGSVSNFSVAPLATYRLTLLIRCTGPVSHSPAGTTTRPPPAFAQASTVCVTEFPYFVMSKSFLGNTGALILARIWSRSAQPLESAENSGSAASAAVKRRRVTDISVRSY